MQSGSKNFAIITPSDLPANNFPRPPRKIYVGGTGNIAAVKDDGTVVLFSAIPVGTQLDISPRRINATNTTATLIVGLFD